jgi:hypothetical protein
VGATTITLMQTRVPPQMRGRVMSLNTLFVMGVRPLGDFPAGALIGGLGGPGTVVLGTSVVAVYTLYLLLGQHNLTKHEEHRQMNTTFCRIHLPVFLVFGDCACVTPHQGWASQT